MFYKKIFQSFYNVLLAISLSLFVNVFAVDDLQIIKSSSVTIQWENFLICL